ncbi:primosomal replication protein [Vibrio sp. D404a]|uniref:primosomal replication protein n=1 Tax=unclassified Vibrio TaxID=2614977 RepID=UPI0025547BD2|nr:MULTISPECIES: primosomal replication protein [unclassified Vibrio]MDK9736593.1 primosomal replication protein [Vibrio sp. D404a]MDK9796902.1 primosomal replication protein [Vibrio sp. D449a]
MSRFNQLAKILETLIGHCQQVDGARGAYHQPLFDSTLFKSRAKVLMPYALETQSNYKRILSELANGQLSAARASHLTEKLTNQIAAIQRELANYDLRDDRQLNQTSSTNQLYNALSQHQDWQRRLSSLVQQKRTALDSAPAYQKEQAEKAWQLTTERLERCEESMKKIQRQLDLEVPNRDEH